MSNITITIDGKTCQAQEGEYVLNIARANDIFIPAICYIDRCSPTLACRVCLVEIDGKQAYACNAKAKDGMDITTTTENIEQERRAIMEVYDVNHPLQCGVCDQSGECELQNYTLEMEVDSQSYAIADVARESQDWGFIHYDPGLCIVCERCTTTCKDMIGDAALKTVPRGGAALPKELKEEMPKDAYAMWNKLNKSVIGPTAGETLDCTNCGECVAVCPVGALVSTDYQYTTNSWELEKVPAACAHCSAGCQINYERKHTDIENSDHKLYRVTNDWNYQTLCGAGRYGYDYQNATASKDEAAFERAVEAFKKADTINFTTMISNEEALILQKLKEKYGYKLVNDEAYVYQQFLKTYSSAAGKSLYSSDLKEVHKSNFVISVGAQLKNDNPAARFAMNNAMTINKGAGIYFHPVADPVINGLSKNLIVVNHQPMQEEAVLYLLLDLFGNKSKMPEDVVAYIDSFHTTRTETVEQTIEEGITEQVTKTVVDEATGEEKNITEEIKKTVPKKVQVEVEIKENQLLNLLGADEKFMESLEKQLKKKDNFKLIVGADLYTHPNSANLARLVALFDTSSAFDTVIIPTNSNALGVAQICDLDETCGEYTIGYNAAGDFKLSALGDGDLDMPAFNQQEGTTTTINKRVVPTNVAVDYNGYVLNDIANALGVTNDLTINYTAQLPEEKGFQSVAFDDLPNHFTNEYGEENRGYVLSTQALAQGETKVEPFDQARKLDGNIVYLSNPVLQFNDFTNKAHQLATTAALYVSEAYAKDQGLENGMNVVVKNDQGNVELAVEIDNKIDGAIAYLPMFDSSVDAKSLFSGYRFVTANIERV
jgi:NADH-quinone oxidoreductase subunit G